MPDGMYEKDSEYTIGETHALLADALGTDADLIGGVALVIVRRDGALQLGGTLPNELLIPTLLMGAKAAMAAEDAGLLQPELVPDEAQPVDVPLTEAEEMEAGMSAWLNSLPTTD